MQNETPFPKTPLKGELLCRLIARYPTIDMTTVQLISLIQAIGKHMSVKMNSDLAEEGLTEGKFYVLAFLFSEEILGHEIPSPSQIADHVGVTRGTVTGLLDGLERDGFVERVDDLHDRRALRIRSTAKAHDFLDSFVPTVTESLHRVLPLSEEEKLIVIDFLSKLEVALNATTRRYCEEQ